MSKTSEPFLSRWSRMKRGEEVEPDRSAPTPESTVAPADPARADGAARHEADAGPPPAPAAGKEKPTAEQIAEIDIDRLDHNSDFTPFMQDGVPDWLRNKAMRKLWASDPIFSTLDGLDDCCEDFSDAVWATPNLQTAYKVGRGFMTDEEVEAWDRLGKPEQEVAAADAGAAEVSNGESAVGPCDDAPSGPCDDAPSATPTVASQANSAPERQGVPAEIETETETIERADAMPTGEKAES